MFFNVCHLGASPGLCLPSCWLSRQYYYVSKLLTWAEAQQNCREQFTDLATFDSMDDIKSLKRPASIGGFVWIGLMDDPKTWKGIMGNASTSWRWSSTGKTSKSGYESWALGEPNKLVGEYCVELVKSVGWLDLPCTAPIPSVCFNGKDTLFHICIVNYGLYHVRHIFLNHNRIISFQTKEINTGTNDRPQSQTALSLPKQQFSDQHAFPSLK